MRLYRYELVETLLKAGIPLFKVDSLRPFLEKYCHRLTSRNHLAEFIPMIRQKEMNFVKSKIAANSAWRSVGNYRSLHWQRLEYTAEASQIRNYSQEHECGRACSKADSVPGCGVWNATKSPSWNIFFLITCLFDIVLIWWGEILSWSLTGVKGLSKKKIWTIIACRGFLYISRD